jgi:hypothetical protein
MPLKSWITQPNNPFDSFYFYDPDSLAFVRIRLELGRTGNNPNPGIFAHKKRYVGFVEDTREFDFHDYDRWSVNEYNEIVYKKSDSEKKVLSRQAAPGKKPIDFTLPLGEEHPTFVHHGNAVVEGPVELPRNSEGEPVTREMLETIAKKVLGKDDRIGLGSSTETTVQLADAIFREYYRIINGDAVKDTRDLATQFAEADAYFNNEDLPEKGQYLVQDNPYADKDGLIEFIVGTELVDDPVVMENLVKQKKYLVALTSVVTDYVNRYAQAYGENYKTDAELWALAMSKLPLMGPSKIDTQSYSRHIKGISIAADFVQFLLDIVTSEGSAALDKFSGFLKKQGEALRFGIEKNKDFYNTITIGVSVEVFKVGDQVVYVPKVKQYKVKFDRANSKWSSSCVSYEYVDINFDYLYAANVFDYESLEDPEIKKAFDDFIQKQRKAQIDKSTTFFNDDFPPKNPQ